VPAHFHPTSQRRAAARSP